MFTREKRDFLVGVLGEKKVARLEAGLGDLNKELEDSGVAFKDLAPMPSPVSPFLSHALQFLGVKAAPRVVAKAASPAIVKALNDVGELLARLKGESKATEEEPVEPTTEAPQTGPAPFVRDVVTTLSGERRTPGQRALSDLAKPVLKRRR